MHRLRRRVREERGETLTEVLVTVSIMGILFVAVLGALSMSEITSDISKRQGIAESLVRSYGEQVQGLPYVNCATVSSYTIVGFSKPTNFTVGPTAVRYWNGSNAPAAFGAGCPSPDQGVQAVDLQAKTADGKVNETLTVYKRVP
jgi:prepilin-type N-terminal cleavage/methylation domain-containing protein